jgi:hypothetical protein
MTALHYFVLLMPALVFLMAAVPVALTVAEGRRIERNKRPAARQT